MIYKVHLSTGERLSIEADYFETDGSGTRLYTNSGGVVASFFCSEVRRIYPETTPVETDTTT